MISKLENIFARRKIIPSPIALSSDQVPFEEKRTLSLILSISRCLISSAARLFRERGISTGFQKAAEERGTQMASSHLAVALSPAMKQMDKIVDKLYARPDAEPFREPVNWEELGLFDYPELIKEPMSLSDVKARLTAGKYNNPAECARDVNLIWQNW